MLLHSSDNLLDLTSLNVNGGYKINEYLSLEARLGMGINSPSVEGETDIDLDYLASAFVVGHLPTSTPFTPYAVLGYSKAKLGAFDDSDSESDVSFGIGTKYNVSDSLTINVEYAKLADKSGVEIDGISFGFTSNF